MDQNKLFTNVRFFTSGIIVCVVGAFGLIGNALTCLTIKMMSKTMTLFNKLLLTLTLIDMVFILTGGAFMTRGAFGYESYLYQAMFPYIIYPMAGLSMTGSTYLCVAIAIERYLGICHRSIQIHRKFRFYLIGIIVLTLLIEFPRFFELEGLYDSKGNAYTYTYARHRWSYSYVTYYCMWFRLFATALVPLAALTFFNAKILIYYRNNNFTQAQTVMSRLRVKNSEEEPTVSVNRPQEIRVQIQKVVASRTSVQQQQQKVELPKTPLYQASQERTLFIMLCCISMTFFCCHLPRLCINIYEFMNSQWVIYCVGNLNTAWKLPTWGWYTNEVSNTLLITNSSVNFVYYCVVGQAFREKLWSTLEKHCPCLLRASEACPSLPQDQVLLQNEVQGGNQIELNSIEVKVQKHIPIMPEPP
eukprot:04210.XXX_161574_159718_1 [CDS] Oithona nana genome sequencing.